MTGPASPRQHSCGGIPERILRTGFHWLVITGCRLLFTLTCRVRVVVLAPVPQRGALIMASNHISHFDPPIISGFFPRRIDWLAMEELFRSPAGKRIFTWLNCIPVERGGSDRTSLRRALHRLSESRVIGIFPEGGIRAGDWSILNGAGMKPGLPALSIHSGTPIIPCALIGSDRLYKPSNWLRRTTLYFVIGGAIDPPREDARQAGARERFAAELSKAFTAMREEVVARFGLSPDDLPQTPQARKGEHP
jgi:1-acyl-sn-glycerol-3-phosphate acyltransferase